MSCFKFLMAAAMLLPSATVFADILYSNTIPSNATTGFCADCILVDDVLVPSARDPAELPLAITSATVGTLGIGSGSLSLYSFPVASDGSPGPLPTLVDTIFVSFTGDVQTATFGNGSDTLLTVTPNFTAQPGFGLLYIGFQANADWLWANGPDANLPTAYLYHQDTGTMFLNTSPGPPFPPNVSYYLSLEGAPVAEPRSVVLLGSAIVAMGLAFHRRRMPRLVAG